MNIYKSAVTSVQHLFRINYSLPFKIANILNYIQINKRYENDIKA